MSSKTTSHSGSRKRLYSNRTNITPNEKRINSSTNQKYKSGRQNLAKDAKVSMSKQELINQHTELLERLQNMKARLEMAQNENKKLEKELRKLKAQNIDNNDGSDSRRKTSNSQYLDQEDNEYSDHGYGGYDNDNDNYDRYDEYGYD